MVLFIFESIGTQELILIGVVALIFLGPRRMPEMARKLGKMMADFRSTTAEFKATWEREVNFEREEQAMRTGDFVDVPRSPEPAVPEIRTVDPEEVRAMIEAPKSEKAVVENPDKRDWL